jgi:hypothetical protein
MWRRRLAPRGLGGGSWRLPFEAPPYDTVNHVDLAAYCAGRPEPNVLNRGPSYLERLVAKKHMLSCLNQAGLTRGGQHPATARFVEAGQGAGQDSRDLVDHVPGGKRRWGLLCPSRVGASSWGPSMGA